MKNRKNLDITVLCGGDSAERPGSILSGKTIENVLKDSGYRHVYLMDISKNNVKNLIKKKPDVAFLTFHGGFGEDGTIQGFLEMLNIPYTSSGVVASAISMNKFLFNRFVSAIGYNTPKQKLISSIEELKDQSRIGLTYPIVIKPVSQGCSYGVFLVNNQNDLINKAKFSMSFGGKILIEQYVFGREFSVGVYRNPVNREAVVLPIAETKLKREIFDFEAKYPGGENLSSTDIPAKLSINKENELRNISINIFNKLGCEGYSMIDVRHNSSGKFYILENNTLPGMLSSEESYIPRMLKASDKTLEYFLDLMIIGALKKSKYKKKFRNISEKEMVKYLGLKLAKD